MDKRDYRYTIPQEAPMQPSFWARYRHVCVYLAVGFVAACSRDFIFPSPPTSPPVPIISPTALNDGLKQCRQNLHRPVVDHGLPQHRLQSVVPGWKRILENATLLDGDGQMYSNATIVIQHDIIVAVCQGGEDRCVKDYQCDASVHDLGGRYLTPGLVDMHSHVGVREVPELVASEDVTEVNHGPLSPWARAIDGLKPNDLGIDLLAGGGITTSLVLTGAKNLISGEGVVIKMKKSYSLSDLVVDTRSSGSQSSYKPQRYLKMACGENIKLQYSRSGDGPNSRQGESYDVRRILERATRLMREQDDWCTLASSSSGQNRLTTVYPSDLELQTLVDVLRGDVRVNVHCYEPQDVFAMYDHADEFRFNVTSLHHALEAHHVLDQISAHSSMLATFSDEWGFKKETYAASAYMLKWASEAGIEIALTSDHPAKNGQFLAYEAQIANHFGLSSNLAVASLTSVPAKAIGLDNRIGYVREGFDADLVVWDRHPLQLGARPLQVMLEGETIVNASAYLWRKSIGNSGGAPFARKQVPQQPQACIKGQKDIVIHNIQKNLLSLQKNGLKQSQPRNMTLVVRDGNIDCLGADECVPSARRAAQDGIPSLVLAQGYITPGISLVTRNHGLAEILSESSTSDGVFDGNDMQSLPFSHYGLAFDGLHLERAHRAGITRLVTPPRSSGMLHGVSAAFNPSAKSRLELGAISKPETALHFTIGNEAKSTVFPTISSQIQQLRWLLTTGNTTHRVYQQASTGQLPVVIHTGNKDTISKVIALKLELPAVKLVIMGGSEAHLVAADLAAVGMPVIIAPWLCHPWTWDVRNCLLGPPSTDATPMSALVDAGVKVALGNWDPRDRYVRNAIWEASWVAGPGNEAEAMNLISRNVEEILELPPSDAFVVYEGNPFEFGASVAVVFQNSAVSLCWPDVE